MKIRTYLPIGLGAAMLPFAVNAQSGEKPNVIIIYGDDVGYGDLGCNGATAVKTPNVDRLASEGVRFTNAHTTSATSTPSRYGLLTGEYPWRRPGTGIAAGDAGMIIKPEQYTMADMFSEAGYTTGAVGKWHLGLGETSKQNWNGVITPNLTDIGFQYSFIMAATGDRVPCVYIENSRVVDLDPNDPIEVSYKENFPGEPTGKDNPELLTKLRPSPNHGHNQSIVNGIPRIGYMKGGKSALWKDEDIADRITDKAVDFIRRSAAGEEPFFLYFGTNDIHVPRYPNERFRGATGMGHRGDAIVQFDWSVGEVMRIVDSLGIADNTIIILSSDNGPVVDDGYADRAVELLGDHKPWGRMRGGKYSNFEAGTRVPMIIRWDAANRKSAVSGALVSHIDILRTLSAVCGGEIPEGAAPDSRNSGEAFRGKNKNREYAVEHAYSKSIIVGDWKYIAPGSGRAYDALTDIELGNDPEPQLYNLKKDIGEKINLAGKYPKKVAELSAELERVENESR